MARKLRAEADAQLHARVLSRRPLFYPGGAAPQLDLPAHVRSASGIRSCGAFLAVISDDTNAVSFLDRASGVVTRVALPADETGARQFDDARGNKERKLDLESAIVCSVAGKHCLLAFGSGSSALRERTVRVTLDGSDPPRVLAAPTLYAAFRSDPAFSGSELNVEGAVVVGEKIRFFQRGNGAPKGAAEAVDATADIPLADVLAATEGSTRSISLENVVQYDLGRVSGVRFTFTDAASGVAESTLYTAAAEDSPDAVRDGPVVGAAVGVISGERTRFALLTDDRGNPLPDKVEGITLDPSNPHRALVVIDADDPERPSELCVVELSGEWWT